MSPDPRAAADLAARSAYGRLLASLSARSRDLAASEDALAEAFRSALETWPRAGVPASPVAWLLTVARRRLSNARRHDGVRAGAADTLLVLAVGAGEARGDDAIPDERLELLFVCAHPAIDPAMRTPLMLQTVLGIDAARIASAFLTAPATMGQRLVRAKAKIRDASIPWHVPDRADMPQRLEAVLEAIYAAYGLGWDAEAGADGDADGLSAEALFLARLVASLLPNKPEARGLAALVAHCEARRLARRDEKGGYVPLSQQDPALWAPELIAEAEAHLLAAAPMGRPGRFQLEAAIQSAHAERRRSGVTPWPAIVALYDALATLAPTTGALVARAVAVAEVSGAGAGLAVLEALGDGPHGYQGYWAARAHLEAADGRLAAARASYARAAGASRDPAVRAFLLARLASLEAGPCGDGAAPAPAPAP